MVKEPRLREGAAMGECGHRLWGERERVLGSEEQRWSMDGEGGIDGWVGARYGEIGLQGEVRGTGAREWMGRDVTSHRVRVPTS